MYGFFGGGVGAGLGVGLGLGFASVFSDVSVFISAAAGFAGDADGVGVGAGLGGLYCSASVGVDRFKVGSFSRRFASAASSILSGSNCSSINASTPIFLTRSKSPGLAPNVNRVSACTIR